MQSLFVVDLLQEVFDGSTGLGQVAIFLPIDLIVSQRLQERCAPGIVVGIAPAALWRNFSKSAKLWRYRPITEGAPLSFLEASAYAWQTAGATGVA